MIVLLQVLLAIVPYYRIEQVRVRFTHFDQTGVGYQSAAGPIGAPGSENATIEQPQAEVVARLGNRITQRLWVPVDVVTAASPTGERGHGGGAAHSGSCSRAALSMARPAPSAPFGGGPGDTRGERPRRRGRL